MTNTWDRRCAICGGYHEEIYVHCRTCQALTSKIDMPGVNCWRCEIKKLNQIIKDKDETIKDLNALIEHLRQPNLFGDNNDR